MVLALAALVATVLCYGTATVFQDLAARQEDRRSGADPFLVVRLFRRLPYVAGTALDGAGFLLSLLALRRLPVFAVQAGVAASIGVTAVVAAVVFGLRLGRRGWAVLGLLGAGLVAVAGSAAAEAARPETTGLWVGLCSGVVVLAVLAWLIGRRGPTPWSASALAAVSGLAYGGVALTARLLSAGDGSFFSDGVLHLLADPLLWGLIGYGAIGLTTFASALREGRVTTVAAVVVVAETVAPSVVGLLLLGDRARPGLGWLAGLGFLITVLAAGLLCLLDRDRVPAGQEETSGRQGQ
jgi:drug/metabolite transporter (DMT)-like permease